MKKRYERLLSRYVEVVGRIVALFTGTYAIEMIARGVALLLPKSQGNAQGISKKFTIF